MYTVKAPYKNLHQYLLKKFPIVFDAWRVAFFFGGFTFLFLFFFEPFGFGPIQIKQKAYWTLLHGGITFTALAFNVQILPRAFKTLFHPENWTRLKHGVWFIWNVATVGSANYVLSQWIYQQQFLFDASWIQFLLYSSLIASIPVGFLLLMTNIRVLKSQNLSSKNLGNASSHTVGKEVQVSLFSASGNQSISINPLHLIYIESNKNYLMICLCNGEKVKKMKLRNTLKAVEKQLAAFIFMEKVHRAFLVNISQLEKIYTAGHAYKLSFSQIEDEIPISRKYVGRIRGLLKERTVEY